MNVSDFISELESLDRVGLEWDRNWLQIRETYRGELDYVRVSDIIGLIDRLKAEPVKPTVEQIPEIWGDGWYAMYDKDENHWWVAPIKYFDEHGHCPDGWDWEPPEGMDDDEFDDFVDEFGCEPNPPKGFRYCMECCISCKTIMSFEQQKEAFEKAGYVIKDFKW